MSRLADLEARLAKGRVIAVVGAGVSIATTRNQPVASWKGLLEDGITHCAEFVAGLSPRWAERQREDLDDGDVVDWIAVATQVEARLRDLGEGEFRDWLDRTIGQLEVKDPALIQAIRDLGVPIATTNYDGLIEEVTGHSAVTWKDPPRIQRVLQGDDDAVIHLHGHFEEPESVVVGYQSYAEVLGDQAAQSLQQLLRSQFSLLYVGFGGSFEDPNFSRWLDWARQTWKGRETYRHYRLCLASEEEAVAAQHPEGDRIFPLPYGEAFADLAPFLSRLALADPPPAERPRRPCRAACRRRTGS